MSHIQSFELEPRWDLRSRGVDKSEKDSVGTFRRAHQEWNTVFKAPKVESSKLEPKKIRDGLLVMFRKFDSLARIQRKAMPHTNPHVRTATDVITNMHDWEWVILVNIYWLPKFELDLAKANDYSTYRCKSGPIVPSAYLQSTVSCVSEMSLCTIPITTGPFHKPL